MNNNQLVDECTKSLSRNSRLRNTFKSADKHQQQIILQAWYAGFVEGSTDTADLPSEQTFIESATSPNSQINKAVAAA